MTLTDTGPLVALLDETDQFHDQVIRTAQRISWPLVTTEACIVEAAYLLGQAAGWHGQIALQRFHTDGTLEVLRPPTDGPSRAFAFMLRFHDIPCDYADATLLVALEDASTNFSRDNHPL